MTNLTVGQELPWDRYRNQLSRHIPFLEAKLGVPAASVVVAEVKLQFEDLFLREYLPQLPMTDSPIAAVGDSGPSRTGFRGESEQDSGLKANRIPVGSRTSIPV